MASMCDRSFPQTPAAPSLGEDQRRVLDAVKTGRNVFFSGVAGTGKSFTIERIKAYCKSIGRKVAVTAPTGAAGLNIEGQTLHSFAGCGVPCYVEDFGKMWGNGPKKAWRNVDVIIIDEAGMVSAEFIDWLDVTVRQIRFGDTRVFGGIQMILCGDFSQLPPVPGSFTLGSKAVPLKTLESVNDQRKIPFDATELSAPCFQSMFWREANFVYFKLSKIFRQSDEKFISALHQLRLGNGTHPDVLGLVKRCSRHLSRTSVGPSPSSSFSTANGVANDGSRGCPSVEPVIEPTVLYCKKMDVERENTMKLNEIKKPEVFFTSTDRVDPAPRANQYAALKKLENDAFFSDKNCQAPQKLCFKVGAQVMLTVNEQNSGWKHSLRLVNGSRGVIVAFKTAKEYENELLEKRKKKLLSVVGKRDSSAKKGTQSLNADDGSKDDEGDGDGETSQTNKRKYEEQSSSSQSYAEALESLYSSHKLPKASSCPSSQQIPTSPQSSRSVVQHSQTSSDSQTSSPPSSLPSHPSSSSFQPPPPSSSDDAAPLPAETPPTFSSNTKEDDVGADNGDDDDSEDTDDADDAELLGYEVDMMSELQKGIPPKDMNTPFPVVAFTNGRKKLITYFEFEKEIYLWGTCYRKQVPLMLAWATTIHKAQGATLDYMICDTKDAFEHGQVYVAISRAKHEQGLQIRNYKAHRVTAHPKACAFFAALDAEYTTQGSVEAFVNSCPLWWSPIRDREEWLGLWRTSKEFREWERKYDECEPIQQFPLNPSTLRTQVSAHQTSPNPPDPQSPQPKSTPSQPKNPSPASSFRTAASVLTSTDFSSTECSSNSPISPRRRHSKSSFKVPENVASNRGAQDVQQESDADAQVQKDSLLQQYLAEADLLQRRRAVLITALESLDKQIHESIQKRSEICGEPPISS